MPFYDYKCTTCEDTFEVFLPTLVSQKQILCPQGHNSVVKLLPLISIAKQNSDKNSNKNLQGAPTCCGGSCGCTK